MKVSEAHGTLPTPNDTVRDEATSSKLMLKQEKAENLITLPESAAVVKALLNFCYSPVSEDDYVDPDNEALLDDGCLGPEFSLSHHAEIYIAADKYNISLLKSSTRDSLIGNLDAMKYHFIPFSDSKTMETDFYDLSTAVDILLENTREEDEIREFLLEIEWGRWAHDEKFRATWATLLRKNPDYAAKLMAYQATDEWVLSQARTIENWKKAAAEKKASTSA